MHSTPTRVHRVDIYASKGNNIQHNHTHFLPVPQTLPDNNPLRHFNFAPYALLHMAFGWDRRTDGAVQCPLPRPPHASSSMGKPRLVFCMIMSWGYRTGADADETSPSFSCAPCHPKDVSVSSCLPLHVVQNLQKESVREGSSLLAAPKPKMMLLLLLLPVPTIAAQLYDPRPARCVAAWPRM